MPLGSQLSTSAGRGAVSMRPAELQSSIVRTLRLPIAPGFALSGALGNAINAWTYARDSHVTIGASTAGILNATSPFFGAIVAAIVFGGSGKVAR